MKMKITEIYKHFKAVEKMFRCPICSSDMIFMNFNSLVCVKNHCFDLSKHGYINFALNQTKNIYTKDLFESRRFIFQEGFYNPLNDKIEMIINKYFYTSIPISILDVGCGEGFFASNISGKKEHKREIFAIDLLKEAIILASKENHDIKWIVGDLSNIPLQSNSMNLLLNIFTPANYNEFLRVMKDDGFLIKVVPGKHYLQELRNCADSQIHKDYSNKQVLEQFKKNMICLHEECLFYQLPVSELQIQNFFKMTPMMSGVDADKINLDSIKQITIDIEIIIGKKCTH